MTRRSAKLPAIRPAPDTPLSSCISPALNLPVNSQMRRVLLAALAAPYSFAMAGSLPVPPAPPDHPPLADAAPVPNVYAEAPVAPAPAKTSVNVKLYRVDIYDPGVAFVPGSRYQTSEDRKPIQTPGLAISVPLN
jgi:hypothetical protein